MGASDLLLEIGAGTGQIGSEIARLHKCYVALDLSQPMLRVFRRRLESSPTPASLIVSDGTASWPIADHCVRAIFGSRSLHLLAADRLVQEFLRVADTRGAMLVAGRVHRDPRSVKARMRREMLRLLGARRNDSKNDEGQLRPLIEALLERGAVAFAPLVSARWTTAHSPADSLESWRSKPGLGGTDTPEPFKSEILSKLESWAREEFHSLDTRIQSSEEYVLEGARLSPA